MRNFFLLSMAFVLYNCSPETEKEMMVKHVFTHDCIPDLGTICPREDFYYVYNYKPEDSVLLFKMTDTLTIDTANGYHTYFFYKYSSIMPDTIELNNKMKDWQHYQLRNEPGSRNHAENLIMVFSYREKAIIHEKSFPPNYRITTKDKNNELNHRFFLKDSASKKLIEVTDDKIRPIF